MLDTANATPVSLEYRSMVASLLACQSASAGAQAHMHYNVTRSIEGGQEEAIVTLLMACPGWRAASAILGGSFHGGIATLIGDVDNLS